MEEAIRQELIKTIQGEIKALQVRYRRGVIDLKTLEECAKPLNRLQKTVNWIASR